MHVDPLVIGIIESLTNKDIEYTDLALTCYIVLRKDRRERRGGRVILYIIEFFQAYEITLKSEGDCEEAIRCNIATKSKGECVIMGDFRHGQIRWKSLESAGGGDHQFLLTQDYFLTQSEVGMC